MSLGYGGFCRKEMEDETHVIYAYSSFNWNDEQHKNDERICDGIITITKSALVEPDIHSKIKRKPNGKKVVVTKCVPNDIDIPTLVANNDIIIENCSNTWQKSSDGIDTIAVHLLRKLFSHYQIEGKLPETESYLV